MIVPKIPIFIRENNLIEDGLQLIRAIRPDWIEKHLKEGAEIRTKIFSEGITNKLFGIRLASAPLKETVIIKVYGNQTDLLIDREQEIVTFTLLHMSKCGAQLYAIFENGICYEFIPGECVTMEGCRSPKVFPLVAKEMARIHKSVPLAPERGCSQAKSQVWTKLRAFHQINVTLLEKNTVLREKLCNEVGYTVEQLKLDINELESVLEAENMPVVFCHNDTVLNNIIYNEAENIVKFIDFEYALPNYGPYDIANHFMEFAGLNQPDYSLCPKKEFRSQWIKEYLDAYGTEGFTQQQFERWVELCIPLSDLYWALWCVIQTEISRIDFDFIGYAGLRYNKFKKHMEEIRNNLYSPE